MALVDPNIAMSYKGVQLADPLAQYGRISAIQNAQTQNQLAQYQISAAQRADAQAEARLNALRAAGSDPDAIGNALLRSGNIKEYTDFMKGRAEQLKAQDTAYASAQNQSRELLSGVTTPEGYLNWVASQFSHPVLGKILSSHGQTLESALKRAQATLDSVGLENAVKQSALSLPKFFELNKTNTQVVNLGGEQKVIQTSGLGGEPTVVASFAQQPVSPDVEAQQLRKAQAGAARQLTNINTYTPASEAAQTEYIKSTRQTYDQLKTVPAVLENIAQVKKLIPTAKGFMGVGGETLLNVASFLNNRLGTSIAVKGVSDVTELRSRLFQGILENLKKLDAQPTEQQQAALQQALGSIGTDPNALARVLDSFADTLMYRTDLYNTEVTGAEARGVKFPYNPVVKIPEKYRRSQEVPSAAQIPTGQGPVAPAAAPQLAPIDQQALEWANANSADPRAAAIKQRLGR